MKSCLKTILISFSLIFILCFSSGCSTLSLSSYLNNNSTNTPSTGTISPINGIDGRDGKDGDSIDLYAIYQQLVELNEFAGTYGEFVREYLGIEDSTYAANTALNSSVSILAGFTSVIEYQNGPLLTETFTTNGYGAGSGIIFRLDKESGDALIITNYHVVYDDTSTPKISDEIHVFLYGQEEFEINIVDSISINWTTYYNKQLTSPYSIPATYLGGSMLYDIAVLKITNNNILKNSSAKAATFANSNDISVGDSAIAIGNASIMGLSATSGIVSVDSEYISMTGVDGMTTCNFRVLRTDAAVNGGNSGGGLFNSNGEVIGIINSKISSTTIENIAYALPSNVVANVAENIIRNCDGENNTTVKRCVLGINVVAASSYSKQTVKNGKLKTEIIETIKVVKITAGSAVDGKLSVGDIINSITIHYSSGESLTITPTRTFHIIDASLTLSVGDSMTISTTNSSGTPNQDITITFTALDVVEYY